MNTERYIRIFAGAVVLVSAMLSRYHSPYWLWLTAFAGFNLFQSGVTGFCPPETLLRKLGVKSDGSACGPSCT